MNGGENERTGHGPGKNAIIVSDPKTGEKGRRWRNRLVITGDEEKEEEEEEEKQKEARARGCGREIGRKNPKEDSLQSP